MATLAVVLAALVAPSGAAADRAYNILPPGQWGGIPFTQNSRDQLGPYDALTPKLGNVTGTDLRRALQAGDALALRRRRRASRRRGGASTILRDRYGVPHITGRTRADVWYGVGWVSARDRQLLLTHRAAGRRAPRWPRSRASTPSGSSRAGAASRRARRPRRS